MNKSIRFVALGAAVLASIAGVSTPAMAVDASSPVLAVSPTTTVQLVPNTTMHLNGLRVSGDAGNLLQVTLATTAGTLTLGSDAGLGYAYGNQRSGSSSITVTGLQSDIDAALSTASLVAGADASATVSLSAMESQSDATYLASTQHFYKYVPAAGISWPNADASAKSLSFDGQPGYLATIPTRAVNDFISSKLQGATNVWFGARVYEGYATDATQQYAIVDNVTYPRVWRWTVGADESPIAGQVMTLCTNSMNASCIHPAADTAYSNWAYGEPNDYQGNSTAYSGEYYPVTNWNGTIGTWNDLSDTNYGGNNIKGYVVEFGGKTNSNSALGTGFSGVVTASTTLTTMTDVQKAAYLGTAANFAVLAGAATTIPGATIFGDVGAKAALTVTATAVKPGVVHPSSDDATLAALTDAGTAYTKLKTLPAKEIAADLAGQTLVPGVYHSTAALAETTPVTFDAKGDTNAIFVIQSDAALNTTAGTVMNLVNGAKSSNIFWVTTGAATLGASSTFDGMILSNAAVTIGASSTLNGHAYSITAAVTLGASNTITAGAFSTIYPGNP